MHWGVNPMEKPVSILIFNLFLQALFTHWKGSIFTVKKKQMKSRMIKASLAVTTGIFVH